MIFTFVAFFCSQNQIIWFDLAEKIATKFQSYYDHDFSDEDFSIIYSSNFSKDPFGDAMSSIEWRSKQLEIAWARYVEQLLEQKWCNLSREEIWWILYYFVPEFRTELAMSLKQEYWDYDSDKYLFTGGKIAEYCGKYYVCEKSEEEYSSSDCENEKQSYSQCLSNCSKKDGVEQFTCCKEEGRKYEECLYDSKWRKITATTPGNVETNCKEFFTENYNNGKDNKEILQNVEVSQIWADKYWNNTTDDSPYDIMHDLETLAKILYYGVEGPITPVLYKIPTFSNSEKKLSERKNEDSQSDSNSSNWWGRRPDSMWGVYIKDEPNNWWDWVSLIWWNVLDQDIKSEDGWWNSNDVKALPFTYEKNWWFDDLVEWLNSVRLENNDTEFYFSLCKEQEDSEIDQENLEKENEENTWEVPDFSDLSDEEYQEIIDYMLDAVNNYSDLPEDKEKEIEQNVWDVDGFFEATDPSEIESVKDQIKNCWKSCEWLRIDQKASCMLKCACWEIKSPIFNPEKTPWLWPIFLIRFCAVPAVNTNFSIGWKRIYSIEEWLNEIYWVVDKLSREWRLWKWTQQYEFLDSSTKKINIADTLAFSIDVEFVDVTNKGSMHSDQYWKKILENFNKEALLVYGISNPLDDLSVRNVYRVVWGWWGEWGLKPMVDLIENSRSNRYAMNGEFIAGWMDQQWSLRTKMSEDFSDWTEYANKLKTKKS